MSTESNTLPALADSAHGQIVVICKEAKGLLGKLEAGASKRFSSSQLRGMLLSLRTIDLAPINEAVDRIAADERAKLLAEEADAHATLQETKRKRELHERYHTASTQQALPS